MKKGTKLLFIGVVVLAAASLFFHKDSRTVTVDPENVADVSFNKEQVLEKLQKLDAPGIPEYIVERFAGRQEVLTGQLNETLDDAESLLTEIRTAFVDGRVESRYNNYWAGTNAIIKNPTSEIRLYIISQDGTFGQCTKKTYSDGQEPKKEELVFYGNNEALRSYTTPGRFIYFQENGNLEAFSAEIDDKKHEIGWNEAGELVFYHISDTQPQNPGEVQPDQPE